MAFDSSQSPSSPSKLYMARATEQKQKKKGIREIRRPKRHTMSNFILKSIVSEQKRIKQICLPPMKRLECLTYYIYLQYILHSLFSCCCCCCCWWWCCCGHKYVVFFTAFCHTLYFWLFLTTLYFLCWCREFVCIVNRWRYDVPFIHFIGLRIIL